MDSWRKIWEGERRDDADLPRPLADHEDLDLVAAIRHLPPAALPVPTIAQTRRAATTFRWRTGLGADALPPRALSL
eukprot:3479693-Pyramimonas_sp.AAC.1